MISTKDHYDFMHIPHNADTRHKFLSLSLSELMFCIFVKFTFCLVVTYVNRDFKYILLQTICVCKLFGTINVERPKNLFLSLKS